MIGPGTGVGQLLQHSANGETTTACSGGVAYLCSSAAQWASSIRGRSFRFQFSMVTKWLLGRTRSLPALLFHT